jgi:hypothetical protein
MRPVLLVFSLLLLTTSCSKSKESGKICFTRTVTGLNIKNNTDKTIYYTAFGQNILPLIDWIPACNDNVVPSQSSISKNLSTIAGYSSEDKLVVYWWECTANKAAEFHSIVLNKYEKECR